MASTTARRAHPIVAGRIRTKPREKSGKVEFVIAQVPHSRQRYETVGDWIPGSPVEIRVSRLKDQRYVFLVALHEMIEYELCKKNGVKDNEVVAFDVGFEEERRKNAHSEEAEPGDDPRAPYRREHNFATMVEMMVAQKLGVKWEAYEKALLALRPKTRRLAPKPVVRSG